MQLLERLTASHAPAATILVRFMVGAVFLSEGIQKFLFPDQLGAGRFIKIGLPAPELLASVVGATEITCGALLLLGLFTRLAAVPLIVIMLVALTTTKIPILLERGIWTMAHESRTDYSMLLGALFLLLAGGGPWAVDRWLKTRQ
jgi:putative oxidoreductase